MDSEPEHTIAVENLREFEQHRASKTPGREVFRTKFVSIDMS
jgi:hypothetical protein